MSKQKENGCTSKGRKLVWPNGNSAKMQTDGFVVTGVLLNEEHYPCLVCGEIPDFVHVDLFTPEPSDIPEPFAVRVPNPLTLAIKYRLCAHCYKAKPEPWKMRLLLLARVEGMVEGI